jgi:tripartite-type tricarboxylate transporter receptor subunit TctC
VQWFGAFAPAKTPRDIVLKVNAEINRAMALPEMRDAYARQGFDIRLSTPEAFAEYVKAELSKWSRVVKEAGIHAD